jgi:DNA-binding IclR family transcriptional regulator
MTDVEQTSPMGSVDKALQALLMLAEGDPQGLTLGEMSSRMRINKATLHRTLAALRFRGFVDQDITTSRYRLGHAALNLGSHYLSEEGLPNLLHPILVDLCSLTDELCHLGRLENTNIVYLDKVEPMRSIRVWSAVGLVKPASLTAMGRAILAALPLDRETIKPFAGSASERDKLWDALVRARETGYAYEIGETEGIIGCVAVAVKHETQPIAAVSLTVPVERFTEDRITELGTLLLKTLDERLPVPLSVATGTHP